jgi:hypothetical protein
VARGEKNVGGLRLEGGGGLGKVEVEVEAKVERGGEF